MTKKPKPARNSSSSTPYNCLKEWPEDCFVQCGGDGVVFTGESLQETMKDSKKQMEALATVAGVPTGKKHYRTAFFEAFPKEPSCLIRGEGKDVPSAEADAFSQFERILQCEPHDFERRNREDGYAFCKKCPLSGSFLEPTTICKTCKKPANYSQDLEENWYCEKDYYQLNIEQVCSKESENSEQNSSFMENESRRHFRFGKRVFQTLIQLGYESETEKFDQLKRLVSQYISRLHMANVFEKDQAKKLDEVTFLVKYLNSESIKLIVQQIITKLPQLKIN